MAEAPRTPEPIRLPLTQLKRGDRAMVAGTSLTDDDKAVLRAMGLDETCEFTVCRNGSGGPCIIQVDATRLGLSPELARRILTRPCDCPDTGHCAAIEPGAPARGPNDSTTPGHDRAPRS
jgi:Fe2+ transport system protein FeoA